MWHIRNVIIVMVYVNPGEGSFILLLVSDDLARRSLFGMMIARPLRDSKKTSSPTFREFVFATEKFSQKTHL